jgi:hypothetical protein
MYIHAILNPEFSILDDGSGQAGVEACWCDSGQSDLQFQFQPINKACRLDGVPSKIMPYPSISYLCNCRHRPRLSAPF